VIVQFDKLAQVALVVTEITKSMRNYWEQLGIGPWKVWDLGPQCLTEMTLRGNPARYSFRAAVTYVGDVAFELVQPLEGESIFKEFLDEHGEGLHHLKYTTKDPESVLDDFKMKGGRILQSARMAEGAFYYLDTKSELGFIMELSTGRALRNRPPDAVFPPD
jgi:hypothetical protein